MAFRRWPALVLALMVSLLWSGTVYAQSVSLLGDFRDWSAYATKDGVSKICFIISKPTATDPSPDGYTQGYLYLTNRPGENIKNELNFVAGYDFAPDTKAVMTIGGQSFELFTQKDAAWLDDVNLTQDVAGAMRAGSTLVIEGTTQKGIKVKQTFSLSGATAASRAIDGACN